MTAPPPDGHEDRFGGETRRLPCVEKRDPVDVLFAVPVALTLKSTQLREAADVRILYARPARYLCKS
jgi:hypothetical protein